LRLPRREQPDRNFGEVADTECLHRRIDRPGPEAKRPTERQLTIEREVIVGKSRRSSLDVAPFLAKQARGDADEARLPAPVRAAHLERVAGLDRQVEILEQQSPSAPERHPLEPQQACHSASSSSACMSSSEKPK